MFHCAQHSKTVAFHVYPRFESMNECEWWYERMYVRYVPLRCFGQHTNSTPENKDIPQGNSIAKLLRFIFLSLQVSAAVVFHLEQWISGLNLFFLSLFFFLSLLFFSLPLRWTCTGRRDSHQRETVTRNRNGDSILLDGNSFLEW